MTGWSQSWKEQKSKVGDKDDSGTDNVDRILRMGTELIALYVNVHQKVCTMSIVLTNQVNEPILEITEYHNSYKW